MNTPKNYLLMFDFFSLLCTWTKRTVSGDSFLPYLPFLPFLPYLAFLPYPPCPLCNSQWCTSTAVSDAGGPSDHDAVSAVWASTVRVAAKRTVLTHPPPRALDVHITAAHYKSHPGVPVMSVHTFLKITKIA